MSDNRMDGSTRGARRRLDVLRRLLPATCEEIREVRPDIWGVGGSNGRGTRKLYRDLKLLKAVPELGAPSRGYRHAAKAIWRLP